MSNYLLSIKLLLSIHYNKPKGYIPKGSTPRLHRIILLGLIPPLNVTFNHYANRLEVANIMSITSTIINFKTLFQYTTRHSAKNGKQVRGI